VTRERKRKNARGISPITGTTGPQRPAVDWTVTATARMARAFPPPSKRSWPTFPAYLEREWRRAHGGQRAHVRAGRAVERFFACPGNASPEGPPKPGAQAPARDGVNLGFVKTPSPVHGRHRRRATRKPPHRRLVSRLPRFTELPRRCTSSRAEER